MLKYLIISKNEKIFKIAHDGDGVLFPSHIPVLNEANKRLSDYLNLEINFSPKDLNRYDALYYLTLGLTNNHELAEEINSLWFTPNVLARSPFNEAMVEVFKRCQKLSHTSQCIITTRPPECRRSTQDQLEQQFPDVNWQRNLHIRSEKNKQIHGEDYKIGQLKLRRINIINEDHSLTVSRILKEVPLCRINYFNQPSNADDLDLKHAQLRVDPSDTETIYNRTLEARENFLSK